MTRVIKHQSASTANHFHEATPSTDCLLLFLLPLLQDLPDTDGLDKLGRFATDYTELACDVQRDSLTMSSVKWFDF